MVIIIILALLSALICLFPCDRCVVHLGSVCTTLFIFITALRGVAAVSERNELSKGWLPCPRSNRRTHGQSRKLKRFLSAPLPEPKHEPAQRLVLCSFYWSPQSSLVSDRLLSKEPVCCGEPQRSVRYKVSVFLYRLMACKAQLTKGCFQVTRKDPGFHLKRTFFCSVILRMNTLSQGEECLTITIILRAAKFILLWLCSLP